MANDEFREQQQAARKPGLKARHETRVERAIRRQVAEEIAAAIEAVRDSVGLFPIENLDDLLTSHQAWTNAAQIARDHAIGEHSNQATEETR